jgi:hypothetical protein
MTPAPDCIVEAGTVLCGVGPDGEMQVRHDVGIRVHEGLIAQIGPMNTVGFGNDHLPRYGSCGMIAMPGLVNSHHHFGLTPLMMGVPFAPLELWLPQFRAMRSIGARLDTLYSAIEMLESGTTTVHHINSGLVGSPENWESVTADQRMVTSGFFEAIGATFVAGRDFTEDEVRSGARVIVVDDRLAARAFPEGAVGRRLQVESNGTPEPERFAEIIGVVRHLRLHDLSRPHLTQIYSPAWPSGWQSYVVRSAPGAGPLAAAIEREVAAVVPTAPVDGLATMSSLAREALAPARFALVLMLAFGAVAVLLAGVGIYGVLAFAVTQRTREIGLRMALGQAPADARRQVLLHGARLVGVALALGLVAAVAAGQGVSHLLFGVSPLDPTTYAAACVSLAGLAMFACWVPARRATRVDPVQALRAQ